METACNAPCAEGTRNADCVCYCGTSQLNGRVLNSNNVPVDGAQIARAERPDVVLATTGSDGKFSIAGVCARAISMIVTKPMFTTFIGDTVPVNAGRSSLNAVIEIMG